MGPRREARETPTLKGRAEKDPERESKRCSQRVRRETRNMKYHRGQEKAHFKQTVVNKGRCCHEIRSEED